jgi:hypothetical protein
MTVKQYAHVVIVLRGHRMPGSDRKREKQPQKVKVIVSVYAWQQYT